MSKHIDKSRFPQNPNVGDVFYADTLDMGAPPVGWRSTGIWVDIRSDEMGVTYRYDGTASDPMPTPLADQVAALEAIRDEQAETIAEQAAEIDDLQEDLDSTSEVDEAVIEFWKRQVVEQGQRIGDRNDMIEALERAVTEIAGERDAATSARLEAKAELYDARQEIKAQERQVRELKEELNQLKPLKRSNGLFSCLGGAGLFSCWGGA